MDRISRDAGILVLDEPTAALTGGEAEVLFRILERLRTRGVGMIYISHKLDEVSVSPTASRCCATAVA